MNKTKTGRAQINVFTTLLKQVIQTLCGIIIPRVMIGAFGSVVYGATTSIAQFLSYIKLFEGGIGSVARGALYGPLASGDDAQISRVYQVIKRFFRKIGIVFLAYSWLIAIFYHDIAEVTSFGRAYTFGLVVVISLSTFGTYMSGIADMTLLHAGQRQYITNTIILVTYVINTLAIVLLVLLKADVMVVKLVSSLVFITRPVLYSHYVKKHFRISNEMGDSSVLSQKWTGMGQHIAYFLHSNTDIILLTIFADLKFVAVYSVYHLVIYSIWNIASSFSGGMEAALGEMIARKENGRLRKSFSKYQALLTLATLVLFGTTAVLLTPFIKLYVGDVSDANYVQPLFGFLLLMVEALNCAALPSSTLPISANQLKESRWGSYVEAGINIVVSCALIRWNPLLGVAIGTLSATVYKCIFYMVYSARMILRCGVSGVLVRFGSAAALLVIIGIVGRAIFANVAIENYFQWGMWGCVVFACTALVALAYSRLAFPEETKEIIAALIRKVRGTNG